MKYSLSVMTGLLAALVSSQSLAEADYTVQIGATSRPYPDFADKAASVGEVVTRQDQQGRTLYQVGRYASRQAALPVRDKLRGAGYRDAFIRALPGRVHLHEHSDIEQLPEAVRSRVVYLGGRLHVLEDGRFIPLADYRP